MNIPAEKDAVLIDASFKTNVIRSFLAYVDAFHTTNGTPMTDTAERTRMKEWVIESVRLGYMPAVIDDGIYRPEDHDAD